MTPTEARTRRHAARRPHLRREMAEQRIRFRQFMRAHQADILALKEAWERINATDSSMWTYQATMALYRDQARRLRCELETATAERDALRRQLDAMTGEL